jgi:hypothetical protein
MKENRLESRLEKYVKSKAEYRHSRTHTALLLSAGAAAGMGALICPPPAEAAVQYSGLKNIGMGTYEGAMIHNIDLDGNGNSDFTFDFWRYHETHSGGSYRVKMEVSVFELNSPSIMNQIISKQDDSGTGFSFARLPGNYTIQNTLLDPAVNRWETGDPENLAGRMTGYFRDFSPGGTSYEISDTRGNFIGKKGYLGVRFQVSGQTHYGWIQFRTDENLKNGTIVDWAYEDQADKPIRAGEGRFDWSLFMPAIANGAKRTP